MVKEQLEVKTGKFPFRHLADQISTVVQNFVKSLICFLVSSVLADLKDEYL